MTRQERDELRLEIDAAKRGRLATTGFAHDARSAVVRAAEHARRAQDNGGGIVPALVETRKPDLTHCMWCGDPSPKTDGVCIGHRDLGGAK